MARKKKSTDTKTLTVWGFKYTFDPKNKKWMEGRKEVNPLVSVMLDELYSKYEKTSTPPQDTEETEVLLSPIPREEKDELSEEVKEDAKLERAEAEQKVKSSESEKLEIIKPSIEVESLVKPTEVSSRDRSERRLPRLESSIAPDALKERVKDITISPLTKRETQDTIQQDRTLNLFSAILDKMQKSGSSSAGSDMFKEAITNLNRTLGIFASKQQEGTSAPSGSKTEKGFEGIVNSEKSSVYLKSIDERIAEILSFLKLEEREEDIQETEAEAEAVKRKLEESYEATGAEIADSVNQSIEIPKGLLDTRLGKQFDTNLARRLDEQLPILNLFTDKLQEFKESPNQDSTSGGTVILGGALGGIGSAIKGGAKSIYRAGAGAVKGLGKAASGIGTSLSGAGKNIFKGAGAIGSGLLTKGRGAGSALAARAKTATKNLSSLGKSVGLGAVSLASGAMGAMGSSAKTASSMTKGLGKSVLKKIPVIGALAGLGFGASRALSGDFTGAAMEVGSGLAGTIPGLGTAASVGLDAALMARDEGMFDSNEMEALDTEELSPAAQQQKPKITNQTAALKEFESQRKMIQDKRGPGAGNTTTIINNNKTDTSKGGGATGILSTAGATRSLYLHYYAA